MGLKTKTVIAALLLLHLLVHPLLHTHAYVDASAATPELQAPGENEGGRTRAAAPVHCTACRTGASSIATPLASELVPLPSCSLSLLFSVLVRPLEVFRTSLPARAPPLA